MPNNSMNCVPWSPKAYICSPDETGLYEVAAPQTVYRNGEELTIRTLKLDPLRAHAVAWAYIVIMTMMDPQFKYRMGQ